MNNQNNSNSINYESLFTGARNQYSSNTVKTREQLDKISEEMIKIYQSMLKGEDSNNFLKQCIVYV